MNKMSDTLRDITDPGWREREAELAQRFIDAIPLREGWQARAERAESCLSIRDTELHLQGLDLDACRDELHALKAEVERLRQDAERYRKWRNCYVNNETEEAHLMTEAVADAWTEDAVDAAIDEAMKWSKT